MARSVPWLCSSCAYWEPYPGWEGVGTCDQELSRKYGRMAAGTEEPCDQYAPAATAGPENTAQPSRMTTCEECHYWLPFELMPRVGRCDDPSSRLFEETTFSDKSTEACFAVRSFDGLDFMWCQSHRQTIYAAELPDHRGCRIFVCSVSLPVEEQMELTLAGV